MNIISHAFKTVDSTNAWAKRQAHEFDSAALTVITARTQTAGRGTQGRVWYSPAEVNLYASFCFFMDSKAHQKIHLAQFFTLQVALVIEKYGFSPAIKWPNDLFLSGKKVGGVLCELISLENSTVVIAGVGLNINMNREDLKHIDQDATSLLLEGGLHYAVEEMLSRLKEHLRGFIPVFLNEGFDPFLSAYQSRLTS